MRKWKYLKKEYDVIKPAFKRENKNDNSFFGGICLLLPSILPENDNSPAYGIYGASGIKHIAVFRKKIAVI